jgi:hypothetical protein
MQTTNLSESDLDAPVGGVFADISHLMATAPAHHPMHLTAAEDALDRFPGLGGSSFPDVDSWPRGGLNE